MNVKYLISIDSIDILCYRDRISPFSIGIILIYTIYKRTKKAISITYAINIKYLLI